MTKEFSFTVILLVLLCASCGGEVPSSSAGKEPQGLPAAPAGKNISDECLPKIKVVPVDGHSLREGSWDYLFNIILVGCEHELKKLTPENERMIIALAEESIRREGPHLLAKYKEPTFRESLQSSVNKLLGKPVVTDAYFNLLMAGEYM